jgi:hypothetical protein
MRKISLKRAAFSALAALSIVPLQADVYDVTVEGPDAIFLAGRTDVVIPAASVNSGTTLMTIANLSTLLVETHVNQVDVGKLTLKQDVSLTAESVKDEQIDAIISFVAPVASVKNGVKGFTV